MAYFNKNRYPSTRDCRVLDAQISAIRDDRSKVLMGRMAGDKYDVGRFLREKELLFAQLNCQQKLADLSVDESVDELVTRIQKSEDRIIGESNRKRKILLFSGAGVLLIGLIVLIRKK